MKSPRTLLIVAALLCLQLSPLLAQNSKENADFKLAINLYNDGLYDLAGEQLKQYISTYPATPQGIDARFYLGMTQLKLKKFDEARLTFQTFALTYQDNPKAPEAWWNVGEAYAALHNYKEAALAFERVKVFHPRSKFAPDALLQAGKYFTLAGEKDNARRVIRSIMQEYPSSQAVSAARTQIGRIYFEEGNLDQAQNELKRVIQEDPSPDAKAQALLVLGGIHQSMGVFDQAGAEFKLILSDYASSSALQGAEVNMGKLDAGAGDDRGALEFFKKALAAKNPDSGYVRDAMIGLGDAQAGLGDFASALATYEKFLRTFPQDPSLPDVLWHMARAAARGKNFKASNDACNRLMKGPSSDLLQRKARVQLAFNAEAQKNLTLAIQELEEFTDRYPEDPAAPRLLLRTARLEEKGLDEPRKAASVYEILATRYRNSPLADDALAGEARCHEQLKEYSRALQLYDDLRETFPASEYRPLADERIRMIETFEAKDKDAGLEKLAMLVGDVVADKDRAGLAYRLGDIYFRDLKNYSAASAQFTTALSGGLTPARTSDALYLKARSLEYLSWKDAQVRPQAIEAYQQFLKEAPADPRADDAAIAVFLLSATSPENARAAYDATVASRPNIRRDTMLLRIGILEERADTLPAALQTYSSIVQKLPNSPSAEEASFRRFELLNTLGLLEPALAEGNAYITAYPAGKHAPAVLSRLGDIALRGGDASTAVNDYLKLTSDFFYTAEADTARLALAKAYAAAGNQEAAITAYAALLDEQRADPTREGDPDASILLGLGKSCQQAGRFDEARHYLFELLASHRSGPLAGEAYATLGLMYRDQGSTDIATSYFRQAGVASPGAGISRDVADLLFSSGNYADAARQYRRLSETAASDSARQSLDARAIVSLLRGDDLAGADKAIAAFVKTYGRNDEDLASFELERGNYYFRKENYTAAMKSFATVADKYDGTSSAPAASYWIANTLEATGKPQEAIKRLDELIEGHADDPIVPRAHFALGNLYYNAEKWDAAIKNYRKVVEDTTLDPTLLAAGMSNLIETYEMAGVFDAALSLTRKYLEKFPHNDDVIDKKIKIGILYERLAYYDQAVLQFQSILDEAGPDLEGELRYYIAEANYDKGSYQQAILDFLKVPYLVTKKGKIDWTANSLYMAGQSYEKLGRYDQALTMYKQIVERAGIDETFKAAAKKEIDRVNLVLKKKAD